MCWSILVVVVVFVIFVLFTIEHCSMTTTYNCSTDAMCFELLQYNAENWTWNKIINSFIVVATLFTSQTPLNGSFTCSRSLSHSPLLLLLCPFISFLIFFIFYNIFFLSFLNSFLFTLEALAWFYVVLLLTVWRRLLKIISENNPAREQQQRVFCCCCCCFHLYIYLKNIPFCLCCLLTAADCILLSFSHILIFFSINVFIYKILFICTRLFLLMAMYFST